MDDLKHYGVARRSGRYPWGSGEDPYQGGGFLSSYDELKSKGMSELEIANTMGITTTQLRNNISWANQERRQYIQSQVPVLKESGMTNMQIGAKLGMSEASVRNYLKKLEEGDKVVKVQLDNVKDAVSKGVDNTGYLDVGVGVERQLGVSRTKFNTAVNKLVEEEGYHVHEIYVKRLNDPNKFTTVKVLTKEADLENVKKNSDKIRPLDSWSDDNGLTISNLKPPQHVSFDRIKVRYAEEGGADKDGLIELRRGVDDLDLGSSHYAQVRIAAGEKSYLKGMVAYADDADFPKGVDIIFNTNKSTGTPKEKVFKDMKDDADNPFGATISRQKGALNIVNQEGDWDTWATTMSSQFLSKQPTALVKDRLEATSAALKKEFDEINSLTNPVVKRQLMTDFVDGLDAKAKHLKAKGLPNTKSHVLLPDPTMKPNEIYAPNYKNGDRVVLVRHPHGGIFEIPELVVNNKHEKSKRMIGTKPLDAVVIHPSVAQKLSGADFDGDTVLVIPNNTGAVKTSRSLKELKNFDHQALYKRDKETITNRAMQTQMGMVSNLITDMTIKGASQGELARAVKHSMVVIDSYKHKLDWKQSARDNGIAALRKKYQSHINPETGKPSMGASTLISRSKAKVDISDPKFNPDKYVSEQGTAVEKLYSSYIKNIQGIKNEANKSLSVIQNPKYSKEAAKKYSTEVKSLDEKLNKAALNAPKERQAQLLANNLYYKNIKPDMNKDDKKKLYSRSLARARETVGADAKSVRINVTDKEWEAIQSKAVSTTKLTEILRYSDMDKIRKLSMPRESSITSAQETKIKSYLNRGYTYAEVASAMGISTSTIRDVVR